MSKSSLRRALLRQGRPAKPELGYAYPSEEQLANFVSNLNLGIPSPDVVLAVFRERPSVKQFWLAEHRRFQEEVGMREVLGG